MALQIRDLIVTAPEQLRAVLGPLSTADRVAHGVRLQVTGDVADPVVGTTLALRTLARRYQALSAEMAELDATLDQLTVRANPALRGAKGVGPDVAAILLTAAGDNPQRLKSQAAFAAMCGVSPIEASSGKTVRHRLNRSGNRQANHALWRIVMVRLSSGDPATKAYVERRTAEGKSRREIVRCLKRHVAREVYRHLSAPSSARGTTIFAPLGNPPISRCRPCQPNSACSRAESRGLSEASITMSSLPTATGPGSGMKAA